MGAGSDRRRRRGDVGLGQAETESEYVPAKCKLMSVLVEGKEIEEAEKGMEVEGLGQAETYSKYMPAKCKTMSMCLCLEGGRKRGGGRV